MIRYLLIALLLATAALSGARAAPVETGNTTAELVSEVAAAVPGEVFWVALKLTPRPGWHTYWRNPGDSGLPTTIEWSLPNGFSAGEIKWPVPHAVPYGPLMNFGYGSEHWLLVEITPPDTLTGEDSFSLNARADWLVCEDICIPEGADLAVDVAVRDRAIRDMATSAGFRKARAALPTEFGGQVEYAQEEGTIALRLSSADLPEGEMSDVRFFPYAESLIRNPDPQSWVQDGDKTYLVASSGTGALQATEPGVIAFEQDGEYRGVLIEAVHTEFVLPISGGPVGSAAIVSGVGLLEAILFAFLGGILLNLMPCVFPILSLKALAVVKSAGSSPREQRAEGLAYTAGVVLSFLAVAGALLAFRAAGDAVGWGFQLQSAWFIAVLAILLFAVGLSLSGYFELGGRFVGIGQGLADRGGNAGAFFTGVLATIVATPCTAPFMAPALGFALTQPVFLALAIFAALGLGMAFPFLIVSAIPALGRLLPKPGPWMERFRQFLAFPMYGTVIWLVWVLGQQGGMNAVAAALAAMMLVPFVIWTWRLSAGGGRILGRGAALVGVLVGIWLVIFAGEQEAPTASGMGGAGSLAYEPYSPVALASYRESDVPVFVNFTAAWCITCLANEQVALTGDDLNDYFAENGVRYLKGDWTKRDPIITAALAEFGRSGVPLYLYYPRGNADPVVLPQLLTAGIVLNELKSADRPAVARSGP